VSSEDVRAQFEPVARDYVSSRFHADATRLAELIDLVEPAPDDVVLDAATGTGNAGLALARHVAWVIGLDLTPAMLDEATGSAREAGVRNVTWVVGDAAALPFPAESFDVYACRAAPHHFPDIRLALEEAWRVLRPGGRAALVDCSPPPQVRDFMHRIEVARDPTHVLSHTVEEWLELLGASGFEVERAERRQLPWRFDDWMSRMAVPEKRAKELAAEIESAPPAVLDQLAPSRRDGQLWHSYWHAHIRARKPR